MAKRKICVFLVLVLILSSLNGCGKSNDEQNADSTTQSDITTSSSLPTEVKTSEAVGKEYTSDDLWSYAAAQSYAYLRYGEYQIATAIYDRLPRDYQTMDDIYKYARLIASAYEYSRAYGIGITSKSMDDFIRAANSNPDDYIYQYIVFSHVLGYTNKDQNKQRENQLIEIVDRYLAMYNSEYREFADEDKDFEINIRAINSYIKLNSLDKAYELAENKYKESDSYESILMYIEFKLGNYIDLATLSETENNYEEVYYHGLTAMAEKDYDTVVDCAVKLSDIAFSSDNYSINSMLYQYVQFMCVEVDNLGARDKLACIRSLSTEQKNRIAENEYLSLYIDCLCGILQERDESETEDDLAFASENIEKLIAMNENNAYAYYLKASLLYRQNQYRDALALYEKAIELDPTDSIFFYSAAYSASKCEDWDKAYSYAVVSRDMVPWNGSLYNDAYGIGIHSESFISSVYSHLNERSEVAQIEPYILDGNKLDAIVNEIKALDSDEATKFILALSAISSGDENASRDAVRNINDKKSMGYYVAQGEWTRVFDSSRPYYLIDHWAEAQAKYPDWDYANLMLGLSLIENRDYSAADYYLAKAAAINADNPYALVYRGVNSYMMCDYSSADYYLSEAEKLNQSYGAEADKNIAALVKTYSNPEHNGARSFSASLFQGDIYARLGDLGIDMMPILGMQKGGVSLAKPSKASARVSKMPNLGDVMDAAETAKGYIDDAQTVAEAVGNLTNPQDNPYRYSPGIEFTDNVLSGVRGIGTIAKNFGDPETGEAIGNMADKAGEIQDFIRDENNVPMINEVYHSTEAGKVYDTVMARTNWGIQEVIEKGSGEAYLNDLKEHGVELEGETDDDHIWTEDNWRNRQRTFKLNKIAELYSQGKEKEARKLAEKVAADERNKTSHNGSGVPVRKPNIYLYPEKETDITVILGNQESITVSIPEYVNGWTVTAYPDGEIKYLGESYGYLFYECLVDESAFERNEAFYIPVQNREAVIRGILADYGFNDVEANDFVEYWMGEIDESNAYYMYPQSSDMIDTAQALNLSEDVDAIYRFWFLFEKTDDEMDRRKCPNIIKINRNGFVVVEWGGALLE